MTSEELGLPGRFDEFMDRRGGKSGIIIEVSEGKYYLDEAKLEQARAT
jgi:rubrerythrin